MSQNRNDDNSLHHCETFVTTDTTAEKEISTVHLFNSG